MSHFFARDKAGHRTRRWVRRNAGARHYRPHASQYVEPTEGTMQGPHMCWAVGCTTTVRAGYCMCRKHWTLVPEVLQQAIYQALSHLRARQPGSGLAYRAAILAAVDAVAAAQEHQPAARS